MSFHIWSWLARFLMAQIRILERYAWRKSCSAHAAETNAIIQTSMAQYEATRIDRQRTQIIPVLSEQTIMEDWSDRTVMEDWSNKYPR